MESNGSVTITNTGASYSNLSDTGSYPGLRINNSGGIGNVVIKSTNSKIYYNFNPTTQGNGVQVITKWHG